jgi:SAM-dependent methyltransferase
VPSRTTASARIRDRSAGSVGWDEYADFYDWENAQTMARRDVPFWQRLASAAGGRLLELGCGTGRVTLPVARRGHAIVGVDLSAPMLARARTRLRRARAAHASLVRADIRALPFPAGSFALVAAPYGVLQSLLRDADLAATIEAVARVLVPGGRFVVDLVADLPAWHEYAGSTRLRGWRPGRKAHVTLIESVRQDRRRGLTLFEQEFVERRGRAVSRRHFTLTFRTRTVPQMCRRLERAGLRVTARLGSYEGDPWTPKAETWVLVAEKA